MDGGHIGMTERDTAHEAAQQHLRPGPDVAAVMDRLNDIGGYHLHGVKTDRFGDRLGHRRGITLDRVGQRIDAGGSGDRRRHRQREFRVEEGHFSGDLGASHGKLIVLFRIGYNRGESDLAAGSGGGRQGHQRQAFALHFFLAFVILRSSTERGQYAYDFGRVDGAASTKGHHAVRSHLPGDRRAFLGVTVLRVGFNAVKDLVLHLSLEALRDPVKQPGLDDAFVRHDQDLFRAKGLQLPAQFARDAEPETDPGGQDEIKTAHETHSHHHLFLDL